MVLATMVNYSLLLFCVYVSGVCEGTSGIDMTRTAEAGGPDVVEAVIDILSQTCLFPQDHLFLRRLAYIESKDGLMGSTYADRNGRLFHGGIWQVDEAKFNLTKETPSKQLYLQIMRIWDNLAIDWFSVVWSDLRKPLFSGLAARLFITTVGLPMPRSIQHQALFWLTYYTTTPGVSIQTFVNHVDQVPSSCGMSRADVVFMLDTSREVGTENFKLIKSFVWSLVETLRLEENNINAGVIKYSNRAVSEFTPLSDSRKFRALLNATKYFGGGRNIYQGLHWIIYMMRHYSQRHDMGYKKIGIVFTGGPASEPADKLRDATRRTRNENITIYAIGVGDHVPKAELKELATSPNCRHIFMVDSFQELHSIRDEVFHSMCKEYLTVNAGDAISSSLRENQRQYFRLPVVTASGMLVKVSRLDGEVHVYSSVNVRYPSPEVHEFDMYIDRTKSSRTLQVTLTDVRMKHALGNETIRLYLTVVGHDRLNNFRIDVIEGRIRTRKGYSISSARSFHRTVYLSLALFLLGSVS